MSVSPSWLFLNPSTFQIYNPTGTQSNIADIMQFNAECLSNIYFCLLFIADRNYHTFIGESETVQLCNFSHNKFALLSPRLSFQTNQISSLDPARCFRTLSCRCRPLAKLYRSTILLRFLQFCQLCTPICTEFTAIRMLSTAITYALCQNCAIHNRFIFFAREHYFPNSADKK